MKQVFSDLKQKEDFIEDSSMEGRWVTIHGRHIYIPKNKKVHFSKYGKYETLTRKQYEDKRIKSVKRTIEKTGYTWEKAEEIHKKKRKERKKEAEYKRIPKEVKEKVQKLPKKESSFIKEFGKQLGMQLFREMLREAKRKKKVDLTEDAFGKPGRKRLRGLTAGTSSAQVSGAKRTKVGQSLIQAFGQEAFKTASEIKVIDPNKFSVPVDLYNIETGTILQAEVLENLMGSERQMTPISSSNVKSVGQFNNELLVQFLGSQGTYRYTFPDETLTSEAYKSLINTGSPGRWIWKNIRGHSKGEATGIKNVPHKYGPAITDRSKQVIGGTIASLVDYKLGGRTPVSRVKGFDELSKQLRRVQSSPIQNPQTGSAVEKALQTRRGFRELGLKHQAKSISQLPKLDFVLTYVGNVYNLIEDSFDELLQWIKDNKLKGDPNEIAWAIINSRKTEGKDGNGNEDDWEVLWAKIGEPFEKQREARQRYRQYKEGRRVSTQKSIYGKVTDFVGLDNFTRKVEDSQVEQNFTVFHGPITRSGPFDYLDENKNIVTYHKDWNNIKEIIPQYDYFPLKATIKRGAHRADIKGYATNWVPHEDTEEMFADVVLFSNIPLSQIKKDYHVSLGFNDIIKEDNIQIITKIDHLAMSLGDEKGRACTGKNEKGASCSTVKPIHDQNLTEVVN